MWKTTLVTTSSSVDSYNSHTCLSAVPDIQVLLPPESHHQSRDEVGRQLAPAALHPNSKTSTRSSKVSTGLQAQRRTLVGWEFCPVHWVQMAFVARTRFTYVAAGKTSKMEHHTDRRGKEHGQYLHLQGQLLWGYARLTLQWLQMPLPKEMTSDAQ